MTFERDGFRRNHGVLGAGITIGAMALAACSPVGVIGSDVSDVAVTERSAAQLAEMEWTFCASGGEYCAFSGTQLVRMTYEGGSVVRSFADGVPCRSRSFGVRRRTRGAVCEIGSKADESPCGEDGVDCPQATGGMEMGSGGMAMGSGGMAMGSGGMAMGSGGMTMDHGSGHTSHDGHGPAVDLSTIPTGDPGVSDVRVARTSQVPSISDGTGAFRTSCTFSHMNFDDPIVYPGQPGAAHLHAYFGNTLADAYSDTQSLMNTGNSTCRGGIINRSSYWVPATVDGAGRVQEPDHLMVYYKSGYRGVRPEQVQAFPAGLRILAGGTPTSGVASNEIYFECDRDQPYSRQQSMPRCAPGDMLRMVVIFPQCWDGVNLDSPDHRSHMAYPRGGCPSTHPVAIPEITYNVEYRVPAAGTGDWRLVSDMYDASLPGGLSLHADWFAAWDDEFRDKFLAGCVSAGRDCHAHLLGAGESFYY